MSKKHQLHILIGCADARDLSQLQIDTFDEAIEEYRAQGKFVQVQTIRAAGSFVCDDVYHDIKHIILNYQKEIPADKEEDGYYVHIQTHGHLTDDCSKDYVSHLYDMRVVDDSPLNCGMLAASTVAIEIEQLILDNKLTYWTPNGAKTTRHDNDIRELLRDVYAYDGFLAGDWVKSIDLLRTHPRTQKARLEKLVNSDPELKRLGIKITAGLMDYSIHGLIRLDDGDPEVPFWDMAHKRIRERSVNAQQFVQAQNEKQKPLAGLICMADPRTTSRSVAAYYYYKYKSINPPKGYLPNTIFNITGSTFDIPSIPFGPYVITGFYYAVAHLGLTDQMVLGKDKNQTDRIMLKIKNDPIMDLIVKKFKVNLIAISQEEL